MAETPKEPEFQTMTAVGKVLVTDDSTAILLGLIGFFVTKRWNTAMWYTSETQGTTLGRMSMLECDSPAASVNSARNEIANRNRGRVFQELFRPVIKPHD